MVSDGVKQQFCAFLAGDLDVSAFEQWVYATAELESEMKADDYLELISARYSDWISLREIRKTVQKYAPEGECDTWELKRDLKHVIDGTGDLPDLLIRFYDLRCHGYHFLDTLGMEYGLTVIYPPREYEVDEWDDLSSESQQKLLASFYPGVIEEAKKVLTWLNDGRLILLGRTGMFSYQYEDMRVRRIK